MTWKLEHNSFLISVYSQIKTKSLESSLTLVGHSVLKDNFEECEYFTEGDVMIDSSSEVVIDALGYFIVAVLTGVKCS